MPGSRCDLPVAHLLASVKCKSLRASVSAQYSQEHEGSCAEGRARAGRQQGALSPPLSGVHGLKNPAYSRGFFTGRVSSPKPPRTPPSPRPVGVRHPGAVALERRGCCTNAGAPWKLAMLGRGARGLGGGTPG